MKKRHAARHTGIGIRRARGWLLRFKRGGGQRCGGQQCGKIAAAQGRFLFHGGTSLASYLESLTVCHVGGGGNGFDNRGTLPARFAARRGEVVRYRAAARNSSTVKPALAISTRSVPRATCAWSGMESVAGAPALGSTMWLPRRLATRQPNRSNVPTTSPRAKQRESGHQVGRA